MTIPHTKIHGGSRNASGPVLIELGPQPWRYGQVNLHYGAPRVEHCASMSDDPRLASHSVITPRGELLVCLCRQCGWRNELWIHHHDDAVNRKLKHLHRDAVEAGLASPAERRDAHAASRFLKDEILTRWAEEHEPECVTPEIPDFLEDFVSDRVLDALSSAVRTGSAGSMYLIGRESMSVLRYEGEPGERAWDGPLPPKSNIAKQLFTAVTSPRTSGDQLLGAVAVIPTLLFAQTATPEPAAAPRGTHLIMDAMTPSMLGVWICVTGGSYGLSGIVAADEERLSVGKLPPIWWQPLASPSAYIDGAIAQTWR